MDPELSGRRSLDAHSHRFERRDCRKAILALEKSPDFRHAVGDCAQHRRAVRD